MSIITIFTRSFHPDKNFGAGGLGFKGDNRKFSLSRGVTSRIHHVVDIDLKAGKIVKIDCDSDPSENAIAHHVVNTAVDAAEIATRSRARLPDAPPMKNDYSQPRKKPRHTEKYSITPYRVDGDQTLNLTVTYAGKNFAFWFADTDAGHAFLGGPNSNARRSDTGSASILGGRVPFNGVVPDLDVTNQISMHMSRENAKARVTLNMSGDGFPNAESFIIDSTGRKPLALATHVRAGTAATQLPGGRAVRMCQTNLTDLDWTKDDQLGAALVAQSVRDFMSFSTTEVAEGQMSVDALNKAHLGRNASGAWHRQLEDHIPIPNARNLDIVKEDIVNGLRQDKENFRNALRKLRDQF